MPRVSSFVRDEADSSVGRAIEEGMPGLTKTLVRGARRTVPGVKGVAGAER